MLLLLLALSSPSPADDADCISCCRTEGLVGCPTRLRIYGPGSGVSREGGAWRVVGAWTLDCTTGMQWDPTAQVIYDHAPADGEVLRVGYPAASTDCFHASCDLPSGACLRGDGQGGHLLRGCVNDVPLTAQRLTAAGRSGAQVAAVGTPAPAPTPVRAPIPAAAATTATAATPPTTAMTVITAPAPTAAPTATAAKTVTTTTTAAAARPTAMTPAPIPAPIPAPLPKPTPAPAAAPAPTTARVPATTPAPAAVVVAVPTRAATPTPSVSGSQFIGSVSVRTAPMAAAPAMRSTPVDDEMADVDPTIPSPPGATCTDSEALRSEARRHADLGDLARVSGDPAGAAAEYRAAITMDNCNPAAWASLGGLALKAGYPGAAVDAFRVVNRLQPNHYGAWASLGGAYEALGQRDLARDSYQRALSLKPGLQDAVSGLARVGGATPP